MKNYSDLQFNFGGQRLVGQKKARDYLSRIIHSERISHAYLFSGPPGTGKTAAALAFAELLNGISNLTDLSEQKFSKKSSWFTHPDIHVFIPIISSAVREKNVEKELRPRLEMLRDDPYEIIDFSRRPSLDDESSKNLQAFYPIEYFHEYIGKVTRLKPNEGRKTVVILTNIETMRKEAANAFLKMLEEPSEDLIFLLTTNSVDALLPTIISRCQHIQLAPLQINTIQQALIEHDNVQEQDAEYLARISGGNYALVRFFDIQSIKERRREIVEFLRNAYIQDAVGIIETAKNWHNGQNIEGQIALLNVMETFLRDLLVYRDTQQQSLIINSDQLEIIKNFCSKLEHARLEDMITHLNRCRPLIYQYVQPKLIFTVLAFRFSRLMRDLEPAISEQESWQHLPAFLE